MRGVRKVVATAIAGLALVGGYSANASSASADLGVSLRVVRSCAVQARPAEGAAASVSLRCSAGHDSYVLVSDGQLAAPRSVVRVEEAAGGATDRAVRTVTLNF